MQLFKAFARPLGVGIGAVLLALCATTALAQTEAPAADDELALGEVVPENEVQVGQTYEVDSFDDWSVRCLKTDAETDPCEMYQLLSDQQGTPIAEVTMFELPDGRQARAGATVVVPLETALQQQLTVQVDDQPAKRYPFAFCNQIGCHARIGLTEQEVDVFRRGAEAVISIVPMRAPDQRVSVTMSLSGFTAGYDKVSELNGT